jgi:hypothetical protein
MQRAVLGGSIALGMIAAVVACTGGGNTFGPGVFPLDGATAPDVQTISDGGADASSGYPTENLGWTPRSGSTPGSVIANLTFSAMRPSSTTQTSISLKDFYDPEASQYDIVALLGVSLWSSPDRAMAEAFDGAIPRVAVVFVVGEGSSPGTPAAWNNVGQWRTQYATSWAFNALDSDFMQLGPAFDQAAVPLVLLVDVRTMEIVYSQLGAQLDPGPFLAAEADKVRSRPPSY